MSAPASSRRAELDQNVVANSQTTDGAPWAVNDDLFLDPMMGAPLAIYIEKDVADKDVLSDLILVRSRRVLPVGIASQAYFLSLKCLTTSPQKHGGTISPGYSGVPYILGE